MAYWSSPASTLVALPFPPPLFVTLPLYPSPSLPLSLSLSLCRCLSNVVPLSLPRPRGSFSRFCQRAIPVAIFHQRPATTPLFILPPRPVAPPDSCICTLKTFYAIYIRLTPQRQRRSQRWRWPACGKRRGVGKRRREKTRGEKREREREGGRESATSMIDRYSNWERKRERETK